MTMSDAPPSRPNRTTRPLGRYGFEVRTQNHPGSVEQRWAGKQGIYTEAAKELHLLFRIRTLVGYTCQSGPIPYVGLTQSPLCTDTWMSFSRVNGSPDSKSFSFVHCGCVRRHVSSTPGHLPSASPSEFAVTAAPRSDKICGRMPSANVRCRPGEVFSPGNLRVLSLLVLMKFK